MLKGHATIELTNVKTGEVEKYEEDNLITNAISEMLNSRTILNFGDGIAVLNNWYLPLITRMMNGIALFEMPIEEDPNITYFPKNNRIVGFGGTKADEGRDSYWGARNLAESEDFNPETKRAKFVWDFKTNQALGTVSCVGLMSSYQGNYYGDSLWNTTNYATNISSYFSAAQIRHLVEWEGDNFICIMPDSGKVLLNTYHLDDEVVGINEKLGHIDLLSSVEITMPKSISYDPCIWKSNETHFYGLMPCSSSFGNSSYASKFVNNYNFWRSYSYIHIVKIDKQTLEVTSADLTMPDYVMPNNGFLVTNKKIILPWTTSSYYYGNFYYSNNRAAYNNISKTNAIHIDIETFTIVKKDFADRDGNVYSMPNYTSGGRAYGIYNGGFQAVTLPNGTYMLNNLILDDDGYVIRETAGPYQTSYSNAVPPQSNSSASSLRISSCPAFDIDECVFGIDPNNRYISTFRHIHNIIINKEKSLIICTGCNYSHNNYGSQHASESISIYMIPLYSQRLMTINNLETPIEKTSDKTMKITYILTEVDEETPSEEENSEA